MKFAPVVFAAAAVVAAASALAAGGGPATANAGTVAAAAAPATAGEVRKVDRAQGKVTLKHGPLENLGMPGMTMAFKVANPKLLDGLKEGDKVKFAADNVKGVLTVTAIETVR